MYQTIYRTRWGSDTVSIRADWTQASAPIQRETEDGWEDTGREVAEFPGPISALRHEVEQLALADGCGKDDIAIGIAMSSYWAA